jgi:hypothetical protein
MRRRHIPQSVINHVRGSILRVVSAYVDLKRAGTSHRTHCPFHEEKTPSFYVHPDRRVCSCFGCGFSGDAIEFVKQHEKCGFVDAVSKAASILRIPAYFDHKPVINRERLALEKLDKWRAEERQRLAEELRDRDHLARIVTETVKEFPELEDAAWTVLETAYHRYSEREYDWSRLIDEKQYSTVELWREMRTP